MYSETDFLAGGGEMGALMRTREWTDTEMGHPRDWPDLLKTTLRLMLATPRPVLIWWGEDLIQFYNDSYRRTLGSGRHPVALGQFARDCWSEIWQILQPQIDSVMDGNGATFFDEQPLSVTRNGAIEEIWWNYSYSPINDGAGVRGVIIHCQDVTIEHNYRKSLERLNQQLVEQNTRLRDTDERQTLQLSLAHMLNGLLDPNEIAQSALAFLGAHLDVSRAYYGEVDEGSGTFLLAHEWKRAEMPSITGVTGELDDFGPHINAALRSDQSFVVTDVLLDARTAPYAAAFGKLGARACFVFPIVKAGVLVAAVTLHQTTPFEWPATHAILIQDVAERIWSVVERSGKSLNMHRASDNERLRNFFRQAPGFVCILDGPNHVFEFYNAAYLRLIGDRPLQGQAIRDVIPELDGQGFFELLDKVYTSGKPFSGADVEAAFVKEVGGEKQRVYVDFVYQPIIDLNGFTTGIFVEGFDVTERVFAKRALRSSEDRLKEGMLVARMVVWDADIETGSIQFSDNATVVLGNTWNQVSEFQKAIHPEDLDRLRQSEKNAILLRTTYQEVVRLVRADNDDVLWIQVFGKVIDDDEGNALFVRGVVVDVTERKLAEVALNEADRRKNEFLAMLAHELRNPLAPISASAQLLNLLEKNDKRVQQASQIIVRQVKHMTSLIDDLLDVSRVTSGMVMLDQQSLDFMQIVTDSLEQVRPLIETKNHEFVLTAAFRSVLVRGDRKRLVQVLTNLLQNAAKYTPDGGRITLEITQDDAEILVQVHDTGVGIEADLLPHVFELFSQGTRSSDRSQGGLGLGLALVKSLVTLHGGRVGAISGGFGQGATMTMALPRHIDVVSGLARNDVLVELPAIAVPLKVLVVDDNSDAADALALLLGAAGHHTVVEYASDAAMKRVEMESFDVCLLDIGLPGMDGNTLARHLRKLPRTAKAVLIALTGYGQRYDKAGAIAAGFDHYYVKPANIPMLVELLAAIPR